MGVLASLFIGCLSFRQLFVSLGPGSRVARLFFFNDTATPEIYTLSLHDALPIYLRGLPHGHPREPEFGLGRRDRLGLPPRSEEHTSELQSHSDLVCRLLLAKKTADSRSVIVSSLRSRAAEMIQRMPSACRRTVST